jgi:transcriptional regulator with XRE-family HTH domain
MNANRLRDSIGANVKTLRERRGLSQEQLAEAVDRTWQAISHIETGKTLPPLTTLAALAKALRVPLGDLLSERGVPVAEHRVELMKQVQVLLSGFNDDQLEMTVKMLGVLHDGMRAS